MINSNLDNLNIQKVFFEQWIEQQRDSSSKLNSEQKKTIQDKTNIFGKAQILAAQTRDILLDLDSESYYDHSIEQESLAPRLFSPKSSTRSLNSSGKSVELLTTLMMLSAEISMSDLSTKLANLMASFDSYKKSTDKLDKELESLIDASTKATKELESALELLDELQLNLNNAKEKVDQKESELNTLDKDSDDYKKVLDELNKLKETAKATQDKMTQQRIIVAEKTTQAENAIKAASNSLEKQKEFFQQNSSSVQNRDTKKELTNAARLSELVAFFMQLVNQNSETELKSQMSVFEAMQKSAQADMEAKAKEIEEQEQKAAELQKTMGCIGKIIGAIITIVSVVSAVFTGGASLALAGIGLALMATDYILEATTGQSLTDRIMAPFMEHVFLPLMNIVQKVIDTVLEYTPLGKLLNVISELTGTDITGIVKTATAALTTIAIIVAVAFIAKTLVKAVAEKLLNSIVGEAIKKILPKIAVDSVKSASKSLVRSIGNVSKKIGLKTEATAQRALQVQKLNQMLGFANQGAQVTSNTIVAEFRLQASKAMASFKVSQYEMDAIKQVLESVIASFEHSQVTYRDLAKLISDSLHKENVTGKQVLNNMRV